MWITSVFFDVYPVIVLGIVAIALFLAGHLTHNSACRVSCSCGEEDNELATAVAEPPRFRRIYPALHDPRDYARPQRCADPFCARPTLTPGQAVLIIQIDDDSNLSICLDCAQAPKPLEALRG